MRLPRIAAAALFVALLAGVAPPAHAVKVPANAPCLKAVGALRNAALSVGNAIAGKPGIPTLDASVKALQAYAPTAPGAIKADLKTVIAAYANALAVLKKANYTAGKPPSAAAMQLLPMLTTTLYTNQLIVVTKRLQAWSGINCHR
jgi:hypothetical protein